MLTKLFLPSLLFLGLSALAARSQVVDTTFRVPRSYYTTGSVYALGPTQPDGKRLVAGEFSSINGVGPGTLALLDAAGRPDTAFARHLGVAYNVYSLRASPGGQYLLGAQGGQLAASGLAGYEVLRLNADGTGDASFYAGSGPSTGNTGLGYGIDYAVQADGKVLVGGYFDTYSGVPAGGLVRLLPSGQVDASFATASGAEAGSYVAAVLALPDGKVLVGGSFRRFGGQPANGLVRLLPNGQVDASFSAPPASWSLVSALLLQPDGRVLVCGQFGSSSSSPRLLRLLPSGSLDASFAVPDSYGGIEVRPGFQPVALQPDGKLLVIGFFPGSPAAYVLRLLPSGAVDTSFQLSVQPSQQPRVVAAQPDGSVQVGVAKASNSFGSRMATLAAYSGTGQLLAGFAPRVQAPGTLAALARLPGGQVLVGGDFTEWNGRPALDLVRLSSAGVLDTTYSAQLGLDIPPVRQLLLQPDGKLLAMGSGFLLRRLPDGRPDASFSAPPDFSYSSALALQPDGKLLVGGFLPFAPAGGTNNGLLRLTSTGSIDFSFAPSADNLGSSRAADAVVVQSDGRVVAGGNFYLRGGGTATYVVRYGSTGALDASFAPPQVGTTAPAGPTLASSHVAALALQPDGKLLVGGTFSQLGGLARVGVARLNADGSPDAGFAPRIPLQGEVYSLALQPDGQVLAGGRFVAAGFAGTAFALARLLPTGQEDATFSTAVVPNAAVRGLLVQPSGAVLAVGDFTAIGARRSPGIARLAFSIPLATKFLVRLAAPAAWPVPAHDELRVALPPGSQGQLVELLDALGRVVRTQPVPASASELVLSVAGLPAGPYLLRVPGPAGVGTRPVEVN